MSITKSQYKTVFKISNYREFPGAAGNMGLIPGQAGRVPHALGLKKQKKAKWLSEEALQIAEKKRELKGKGEKERYAHLNAETQIIAKKNKKAFLSDQCKEIEENNRMGKTRDLFKKIKDTKVTKMSTQRTEMVWA